MKKYITIFMISAIILLSIAGCASNNDADSVDPNESLTKAPDFTESTLDGRTISLSDYEGKTVVINFWGIWCPYCVQEMPAFHTAAQEYTDVVFLMINTSQNLGHEDPEDIHEFLDENKLSFDTIVLNDSTATVYGIRSFPSTLVINKDGYVTDYVKGAISYNLLTQMIDNAQE